MGALEDLVTFARLEADGGDIEPWAAVLAELHTSGVLDDEAALWAVKLYNCTDDFGSAFRIMEQAPTPARWGGASREYVAALPLSAERRNLRGGKILRHLDSYTALLGGQSQREWLTEAVPPGADRFAAFGLLMPYLRRVWGVGRLSAFEWAEFCAKVGGLPVETPDACLWESSGPRESLQRLYGEPNPTPTWLHDRAVECRSLLAEAGVALTWWDFETVICDFNVMRKGRYYPGKHIAMVRAEIEGLSGGIREVLRNALRAVIPAVWRDIPPGADAVLGAAYRDRGLIVTPVDILKEAA